MNILLMGSGGREDALAWRLKQSPSCDGLIAAPGNPGIARWAECVAIDPCDPEAVVKLAQERGIDLIVIGPEAPLVAGVSDVARAAGIATFGPSAAAARLEGYKGFTVAMSRAEAEAAIRAAGDGAMVIEEFLEGEEASLFALVDGTRAIPLA